MLYYGGKNVEIIKSYLSTDFNNLSEWRLQNELALNLKRNTTDTTLFDTLQRLSRSQRNLSVIYTSINVTTVYKYLGIELDLNSHFEK